VRLELKKMVHGSAIAAEERMDQLLIYADVEKREMRIRRNESE
jgi:hypothetical protein